MNTRSKLRDWAIAIIAAPFFWPVHLWHTLARKKPFLASLFAFLVGALIGGLLTWWFC